MGEFVGLGAVPAAAVFSTFPAAALDAIVKVQTCVHEGSVAWEVG